MNNLKTHNQDESIYISGTHLLNQVATSYDDLVALFGAPIVDDEFTEWNVEWFEDDEYHQVAIYSRDDTTYMWNIGARTVMDAWDIESYIIEHHNKKVV